MLAGAARLRACALRLPSTAPVACLTPTVVSASSSRVGITASSAMGCRSFSSSQVARGMSEFFPPKLKEGETEPKPGRSWSAAELRLKSFEDLHRLWFVCLKERNMLLSDRLYHAQIGQAAPDGGRMQKVRSTMARIKVVISERMRAEEVYQADQARLQRLSQTDRDKLDAAKEVLASAAGARVGAGAGAGSAAGKNGKAAMVTYKRFGRTHTVPAEQAPAKPTRQAKRVAFRASRTGQIAAARTAHLASLRAGIEKAAAAKGSPVIEGPAMGKLGSSGAGSGASAGSA